MSGVEDSGLHVSKERIAALFDGIVAITATLLILEVKVPTEANLRLADLLAASHHILHWGVSFAMVAVIWVEFHTVFRHSTEWDSGLLVATFLQLGAISLIPFASGIVGEHPENLVAALVFAGVMALNGIFVSINALVLRRKHHLHAREDTHRDLGLRVRSQILVYGAAIGVSIGAAVFAHPYGGIIAWVICPLALGIHHSRLERAAAGALSNG